MLQKFFPTPLLCDCGKGGVKLGMSIKSEIKNWMFICSRLPIFLYMERIIVDQEICNGQPVIRGTRITAQTILDFLAAGDSVEDVLREYPSLTREDVLDCMRFSSDLMKHHFTLRKVS